MKYHQHYICAALLLLASSQGAEAACSVASIIIKDSNGTPQTFCIGGSVGQFLNQNQIVDSNNNIVGSTSNALDVNVKSGGTVAQGSTTTGQQGSLIFGAATTNPTSLTTGFSYPLSLDLLGNLRVLPAPSAATTTQTGSSVTTQNIFQSALASNATRKGATLQNTSAVDVMYVFFGATGSATKAASFQISPGGSIQATTGTGVVLTDNIAVTCVNATPANCTYVVSA